MELVFVFFLGAAIGSFLNVCIYRMPRELSLIWPPSRCSFCGQHIAWYDNIPIISFVILRGQCRYCGSIISPRYFGVELLTALLFTACYVRFVGSVQGYEYTWALDRTVAFWLAHPGAVFACVVGWAFLSSLVVATFVDFEFQIIPDSLTLGGMVIAVVLSFAFPYWHPRGEFLVDQLILEGQFPFLGWAGTCWDWVSKLAGAWENNVYGLVSSCLGACIGAAIIWIVGFIGKWLFRKEAMGLGDVKFNAMVGALLGWRVAVGTLFLGAVLGAMAGIVVIIRTRQSRMPFGPYLSLAAALFLLFPDRLFALPVLWNRWITRHLLR